MAPSSFIEETQIVAQSEPEVPRLERVAILMGLTAFLLVLAVGLALYLAKFKVDASIVKTALGLLAVGSVAVFFRMTPASRLTPVERMVRGRRQVFVLLGLLTGAAVLGSIATAAELDTARDWAMLAFIASSPIGIGLLVRTRFSIG